MPDRDNHERADTREYWQRRLVGKLVRYVGTVGVVKKITTYAEHYGPTNDDYADKLVLHIHSRHHLPGEYSRQYLDARQIHVWGEDA